MQSDDARRCASVSVKQNPAGGAIDVAAPLPSARASFANANEFVKQREIEEQQRQMAVAHAEVCFFISRALCVRKR